MNGFVQAVNKWFFSLSVNGFFVWMASVNRFYVSSPSSPPDEISIEFKLPTGERINMYPSLQMRLSHACLLTSISIELVQRIGLKP